MQAPTRTANRSLDRRLKEVSAKFGTDPALIGCAALLGLGLGGLLHRILIALFERGDRLFDVPSADGAALRDGILAFGPWIVLGLGIVGVLLARRSATWSARRVTGLAIAFAGFFMLIIGALELHVFRTLEEGWEPKHLWWDVAFHGPGEMLALAGWLLLPGGDPA